VKAKSQYDQACNMSYHEICALPDGEGHIMLLKEKFTIALPVCPGGELLKNAHV